MTTRMGIRGFASAAFIAAAVATGGCSSSGARVAGEAGPDQKALFESLKTLEGRWMMTDPEGATILASVYEVSSNGSVVRETMFPGQTHEMTNLYHFDGASVVVTHYCAAGNQPRMRAVRKNPDGSIDFRFDSVTNLKTAGAEYMGGLKLVMPSPDRLEQHWTSYSKGKEVGEHAVFELTRAGA